MCYGTELIRRIGNSCQSPGMPLNILTIPLPTLNSAALPRKRTAGEIPAPQHCLRALSTRVKFITNGTLRTHLPPLLSLRTCMRLPRARTLARRKRGRRSAPFARGPGARIHQSSAPATLALDSRPLQRRAFGRARAQLPARIAWADCSVRRAATCVGRAEMAGRLRCRRHLAAVDRAATAGPSTDERTC